MLLRVVGYHRYIPGGLVNWRLQPISIMSLILMVGGWVTGSVLSCEQHALERSKRASIVV